MFRYPYSKGLSAKPPVFSIWKLNAELPPVRYYMKRQIRQTRMQVKNYRPPGDVRMRMIRYPSSDGTELPCYVLEPAGCMGVTPAILYCHGGGFTFPVTESILNTAAYYAQHTLCRVFLPEYRLAPEHSCRVLLMDCYDMLLCLFDRAEEYQIDKSRVLLYGDSAGGALAAGVALMARDRKGPRVRAQFLVYPVTDRRSGRYPSMRQYRFAPWTRSANRHMWNLYLKKGACGMLRYASPMEHTDFSGLPPAYIEAEEIDVLRDEAAAYGKKLKEAGVPVKRVLVRGSYHGFDSDQTSSLTRSMLRLRSREMCGFLK